MTTPAQPPPGTQQQLDQFLVHAAELYALEQLASKMAVGPLRKQVQGVWRKAAALWVGMFGALDNPATPERHGEYLAAVRKEIAAVEPRVAGPLAEYVDKALAMGVQHAADVIQVRVIKPAAPPVPAAGIPEQQRPEPIRPGRGPRRDWPTVDLDPVLSDTTTAILGSLDPDLQQQLIKAEHAIESVSGDRYSHVTDALVETQKTVTAADRATTVVVNEAANTGSDQLAEKLGAARLWIAERNACVHCLAYAGEVAPAGGSFPVGLTFGKKPLVPWPDPNVLPGCPLHPNCRCRTTPWLGHVEGAPGPSLPEVLKREAQRSILTGWRTETESEGARVDAAARLLRRGTTLPKSVQQRARQAVKRGRFNAIPRRK